MREREGEDCFVGFTGCNKDESKVQVKRQENIRYYMYMYADCSFLGRCAPHPLR